MSDTKSSSASPMKLVWMVIVFIAIFLVLKFVVGIAFTIMKWVAIGGIALGVVYFLFSKDKGKKGS